MACQSREKWSHMSKGQTLRGEDHTSLAGCRILQCASGRRHTSDRSLCNYLTRAYWCKPSVAWISYRRLPNFSYCSLIPPFHRCFQHTATHNALPLVTQVPSGPARPLIPLNWQSLNSLLRCVIPRRKSTPEYAWKSLAPHHSLASHHTHSTACMSSPSGLGSAPL